MKEDLKQILKEKEEYFIDFLKKMISLDSEDIDMGKTGKEKAVQEFIASHLEKIGAKLDIFEPDNETMKSHPEYNPDHSYAGRPDVVGIFPGTGGGQSLLINAHCDVVPAGDPKNWVCPPYDPQVIDGKLYGRGSCDMKAGGAAALLALEILKEQGIKLKGDVIFESVVDEEGGGNGTLACCLKGYKADAAIIPEPTELKLMPAHMGWLFYRVTFVGKPKHCAFKWNGVNAVEKCLAFMNKMQDVERRWEMTKRHPYLPPPTICFTMINGGTSSSTVPEKCVLDMTVHFHPCETENGVIGAKIERELMREIDLFQASDPWFSDHPIKIEMFQQGSAYDIGADHPIVRCAGEALERIRGSYPEISGLASGADARLTNNYADTPTLLCGPGSIGDAHSDNEFVEVRQFLDAIAMFCDVFMNWCGTE